MSDLVICEKQELVDVADAIRAKTGRTDSLTLDEMASDIQSISVTEGAVVPTDIPYYWLDATDGAIAKIKSLQDAGGKDCFSFIVMTDVHYSNNLGKISPVLARHIMDECNIRYALVLGDLQSRGSWGTEDKAKTEWDNIKNMFEPIADRALFQRGNHDGSWGATLNGVTYPYNFTPAELYNRVYANTYCYQNAITDESGTGYYIDDVARKVRYIMLNTQCNPYAENADGSAAYNNMKNFRFTQTQYDMLIDALATVTDEWAVVVAAHVPVENNYSEAWGGTTTAGDHVVMRNLLKAYKEKKAYNGSWAGTHDYDAVNVSADFSSAKGELVGYFSGHMHADNVYAATDYFGFDIITTRCDGHEENNSTLNAERVIGTNTEQSFDVFTVNRDEGVIYATKIGAGNDRIIGYTGTVISTHSISNKLTNCSNSSWTTVVKSGSSYSGTITANNGYTLSNVTITMGGTDITSTVYSNGVINITSVTGNVVITAVATLTSATYTITNNLTKCSNSNTISTINSGSSYSGTITANSGYELSSVIVTMGGTDITSSAYSGGVINISSVTGDVVITATATLAAVPTYSITNNLTECSTSNTATAIESGSSYSATITPNDKYELSSVTVTMGGTDITSSAYSNGIVTITNVTGNIIITATAVRSGYTNLFDTSGDGFSNQTSKFYTNWIPYNGADNDGNGTIYHFKGLTDSGGYPSPYKMQFKAPNGNTSDQVYCTNANRQAPTAADYDSSVKILQHSTTEYIWIQFEIREPLPDNLIITANENIED